MALPANYNISYYRGDTYKFYINVKDAAGDPIDLSTGYTVLFTIADERGASPSFSQTGTATINGSVIECAILPSTFTSANAGPYVYDIQVTNNTSGDVYTYLNGTISITQDISGAV